MAPATPSDELYLFACPISGPRNPPTEMVGAKARGLILMAEAGLPVPPGFVLPTAVCRAYLRNRRLPPGTADLLRRGIREVEKATGLSFGADRRPLLVSVRSGAAASMPGMMDTVLNIGLCDRTLPALLRLTGKPRHAWDSYRRLVRTYAEVVHGLPPGPFQRALEDRLRTEAVPEAELDAAALRSITRDFLDHFREARGEPFPQDPYAQLTGAVEAVFHSWEGSRAAEYRRLRGLDDQAGTAVTVQTMVFGNMGVTSGSGVAFTRDPATGENTLYLDFLSNAQGEDVVSGRRLVQGAAGLQRATPELHRRLREVGRRLEQLFRDAQDFEFTVQEGRLYLLQARSAKRTAWAALRIACELVAEGLIDEAEALRRLAEYDLASIHTIHLVAPEGCPPLGAGVPAGPGVAVGEAVFEPARAVELAAASRSPILVRADVATDDVAGLAAAAGLLTARGGRTSHAAVVARQLNKVCIVGCQNLVIPADGGERRLGSQPLREGTLLSLDGHTGRVYAGSLEAKTERPTAYLEEVQRWKERLGTPPVPAR